MAWYALHIPLLVFDKASVNTNNRKRTHTRQREKDRCKHFPLETIVSLSVLFATGNGRNKVSVSLLWHSQCLPILLSNQKFISHPNISFPRDFILWGFATIVFQALKLNKIQPALLICITVFQLRDGFKTLHNYYTFRHLKRRKSRSMKSSICLCIFVYDFNLNFWTDHYETWHKPYAIRGHFKTKLFDFIQSVITTWRMR